VYMDAKMNLKHTIAQLFHIQFSNFFMVFSVSSHCKPIPVMKTGFSLCTCSLQGKTCFHYREGLQCCEFFIEKEMANLDLSLELENVYVHISETK
jgi:hypothetical protein